MAPPLQPPQNPSPSQAGSPAPMTNGFDTGTLLRLAQAAGPAAAPAMTPQEKFLYDFHLNNLQDGGVLNPKGGRSTIYNITTEIDGKHYVLPTVWDGKIHTPDEAVEYAKKVGLEKFPSYASENEAEAAYSRLHDVIAKDKPPIPQASEAPVNPLRALFLKRLEQEQADRAAKEKR